MNTFANTLFSAMLGWVRDIIAGIFRMVSSGIASSFLNWIVKNWLPLVGVIIMAGIVLDLLVWIIRWRPHYVWLSNRRSLHTKRQIKRGSKKDLEFETGYGDGIGYEFFEEEEGSAKPINPEWEQPAYNLAARYQVPGLYIMPEQEYAYGMQSNEQPADGRQVYSPSLDDNSNSQRDETAEQTGVPVRKRRSEQHKPKLFGAIGKFGKRLLSETADEQLIESLPPPVAKKDAFYDPVYPSREPLDSGRQTNPTSVLGQPNNKSSRESANGK